MTLKELLSICPLNICGIEATIRDNGKFLDEYHISPMAQKDRMPRYDHHKGKEVARWHCIQKPINYKDIGKDYWGVFNKNIPKQLLDMTVTYFDIWDGWRTNNGLNQHKRLICNLTGADTCIAVDPEPKQIKASGQIEGQMSLDLSEETS
jgi:hypothetical protein